MAVERVVVTGATGHLGRYVVHALRASGLGVTALSRSGQVPEPPFGESALGGVVAQALDLEREDAVDTLSELLGPGSALVHLAAWHPPATATTTPQERRRLMAANVFGTMRALEAARKQPTGAVVYASTFEVYGLPEAPGAVAETARLSPLSDYGASKLAGEDHLLAFAYEERMRVAALRLPAIYGPGELTSRALPNFLKQVVRGERPCVLGSGLDLRDQIHARDAAQAVLDALKSEASGIFNVADGQPHSILELARTALQVAGVAGEPEQAPSQKPSYDFHMSIDKARRELGFEPQVSLAAGMAEQLAWLRSRASV
jgi:nucleoside-diphosphate-sugar epimerase